MRSFISSSSTTSVAASLELRTSCHSMGTQPDDAAATAERRLAWATDRLCCLASRLAPLLRPADNACGGVYTTYPILDLETNTVVVSLLDIEWTCTASDGVSATVKMGLCPSLTTSWSFKPPICCAEMTSSRARELHLFEVAAH